MLRFIEHFLWIRVLVQWYQDLWIIFGKLVTVTAATEKLLKALRINNEEILSVEGIWVSSTDL